MPSLPGFIGVRLRTAVLLAIAAIPLPAQQQGAQVPPGLESVTSRISMSSAGRSPHPVLQAG